MEGNHKSNKYDGFIYNNVVYLVAMFIGSFGALIGRILLSFFLKTPSITELDADASFYFNVIYPIAAIVTNAGFFAGGFFCCYFAAYKIGYNSSKTVDPFVMKMQYILPSFIITFVNIYEGFYEKFLGMFGFQFWYPAAVVSSWIGKIDKTDISEFIYGKDIEGTRFVLDCLAYRFNGLTILFSAIIMAAFVVICYYGRKKGMKKGIEAKEEYIKTVRGGNA